MAERIFIVDDEKNMARAIAGTLGRSGYQCEVFFDGPSAIQAFKSRGADLVLTDQAMPGMKGITLMGRLHQLNPRLPVILITAFGGIANAVEAMKQGAFDYMTKPFDNAELRTLVARALQLNRLESENKQLRQELSGSFRHGVIAQSPAMKAVLQMVRKAAGAKATVLIQGESGTGKEIIARLLHFQGPRVGKPFVAVNCKAFAEGVLESELFGHEKGAFTGAQTARAGCFERAHGGTLFLDEIGDISPEFQAKLLRVLQEEEVVRVGGSQTRPVDVRVLAATNVDLADQITKGGFREDLYFRLNVIPIQLSPLRERPEDLLPLARLFLDKQVRISGRSLAFSQATETALLAHSWPGNVRELENTVERAGVLCQGDTIEPEDLLIQTPFQDVRQTGIQKPKTLQVAMDEAAEQCIGQALKTTGGKRAEAAAMLGVDRTTLYRLMKRLGIPSPD